MTMKKILIPLDGTERSTHSVDLVKALYPQDTVEITLVAVREVLLVNEMTVGDEFKRARAEGETILEQSKKQLEGYTVKTEVLFGFAADQILTKAKEDSTHIIVMTKSTKKGLTRMIGSVTSSVVRNAQCIVMIVPE